MLSGEDWEKLYEHNDERACHQVAYLSSHDMTAPSARAIPST